VAIGSSHSRRAILARGRDDGWDHAHLLKVLFAEQAAGRDRSTREMHRKAVRLAVGQDVRCLGPEGLGNRRRCPSGAPDPRLDRTGRAPRPCRTVETGKSHFAEAIAHAAIDRDLRVSWFTLETVTTTIARSRIDATSGKVVVRIVRSELIVVDDIGLLPAGADEAEALYRMVDAAYEKRSLILTSNLHRARFDSIPEGPRNGRCRPPASPRPRHRHRGPVAPPDRGNRGSRREAAGSCGVMMARLAGRDAAVSDNLPKAIIERGASTRPWSDESV
jgi:hypothetical protein